jgi:hypothetical protein
MANQTIQCACIPAAAGCRPLPLSLEAAQDLLFDAAKHFQDTLSLLNAAQKKEAHAEEEDEEAPTKDSRGAWSLVNSITGFLGYIADVALAGYTALQVARISANTDRGRCRAVQT